MKIAVVGSGIAGLGAAYVLSRLHEVELFERDDRPGGHTNTVSVGRHELDTGFIVHNERNYPLLTRLFRELDVETQRSEMSFSVSCGCGVEYSGRRPLRAGRLLGEIVRFLRTARDADYDGRTLAQFARAEGYSAGFSRHYLMPLTAAIWSTAPERALEFPAAAAIRFFDNHSMLGFRRRRWRAVTGGSRTYVDRLLERSGLQLRLGLGVRSLRRDPDGVELVGADGVTRRYDAVVVATHPDQALGLLADPSDEERRLLGAFRFTANDTVLHTDERFLPRREGSRSSWNYQLASCTAAAQPTKPTLTYYLNRLQDLDTPEHFCVTLNRTNEIRHERIIERFSYEHPQVSFESLAAQGELPGLNGVRRTAFAGAWHGHGFHEDGLAAGIRAAAALGVRW